MTINPSHVGANINVLTSTTHDLFAWRDDNVEHLPANQYDRLTELLTLVLGVRDSLAQVLAEGDGHPVAALDCEADCGCRGVDEAPATGIVITDEVARARIFEVDDDTLAGRFRKQLERGVITQSEYDRAMLGVDIAYHGGKES
jgi:hypothetical protein